MLQGEGVVAVAPEMGTVPGGAKARLGAAEVFRVAELDDP